MLPALAIGVSEDVKFLDRKHSEGARKLERRETLAGGWLVFHGAASRTKKSFSMDNTKG